MPNANTTGTLTTTVQPNNANAPTTYSSNLEQDSTMPPPSPFTVELNRALLEMLAEPSEGEATLSNAATALYNTGSAYPYNSNFDPTSQFDVSFNPNSDETGGAWDAFDASTMGVANEYGGLDWSSFVNDDHLT